MSEQSEMVPAHNPAPDTHCMPCDVPWVTHHTVDADTGVHRAVEQCPLCGARKPGATVTLISGAA